MPATAPFPDPREPVSLAEDGGGGRARRDRDAGPGRAHALRARRGQRQVRGALPPRSGEAEVEGPEQTDWRDWGADLPDDPAERARMAEVKLAEALAVLGVLKAPGPASLTSMEKWRAGELARERCPLARLRDVTETLSIPKSTYLDQAAGAARADPKAALRARVRESAPFPLTLVLPFRHDVPNGERRERRDTRHPSTPPSSSSGRRGSTASAAARTPSSPASSAATPAAYRTGSGGPTPRGPPPTRTPSRWPGSRAGRGARTTVSGPRTRYF